MNVLNLLAKIIFPERRQENPFVVEFCGYCGVGKSFLNKKLRSKFSRHIFGINNCLKFFRVLKMSYTPEMREVIDYFSDKDLCNHYKKILDWSVKARCNNRNFYIDEAFSAFPPTLLKGFYNDRPDLFKKFYKNTIIIYLYDTPEKIFERDRKRYEMGKRSAPTYKDANFSLKGFEEQMKWLENFVPVLWVDASLPLDKRIKLCRDFIQKYIGR